MDDPGKFIWFTSKNTSSRINFSFGLHEKFGRVAPVPLSSAWLQSKMAGVITEEKITPGAPEAVYMDDPGVRIILPLRKDDPGVRIIPPLR